MTFLEVCIWKVMARKEGRRFRGELLVLRELYLVKLMGGWSVVSRESGSWIDVYEGFVSGWLWLWEMDLSRSFIDSLHVRTREIDQFTISICIEVRRIAPRLRVEIT